MSNTIWSFHDVFSKLVPQSSKWQFNQRISYPLSDLIVLDETLRRQFGLLFSIPFDSLTFYRIWNMIVGTYDCTVWYKYSLNISTVCGRK